MIRYSIIATFLIFLSLSVPVSPAVSGEEHYPEVSVQEIVENKERWDGQRVSVHSPVLDVSIAETMHGNLLYFFVLGEIGEGYYVFVLLTEDYKFVPSITHATAIGTYHISEDIEGIVVMNFIRMKVLF